VLNVSSDAEFSVIKQQYHRLVLKLHPDRNTAPGAEDAFHAVKLAYQILSNNKERAVYDNLLKKGEGLIDTKVDDTLEEPVKTGIGWSLLRLLFIFVGVIFLVILVVFKLFKGILIAVKNLVKFKPKKQMKWCDSCREYHVVSNDEGEVWEENGRYFYRRDGTVHDVTDFVQGGFFTTQPEFDDDGDEDYERNYPKGRKNKKK
jgi:curved DNA-binding protein CbpA